MSQPKSADPLASVPAQKPRTNVYTMMLLLSLVAIITAIVVLSMALKEYGPLGPDGKRMFTLQPWKTSAAELAAPLPSGDRRLA